MTRELLIRSAVAGLIVFGLGAARASTAADQAPMEKCGGIAKAGKNDCAVKGATHSCAGQAKKDGEKDAYIYLPAGTCNKIVGGVVLK